MSDNLNNPADYLLHGGEIVDNISDRSGVMMIYQPKMFGEEWYLDNNDPTHDPRFRTGADLVKNKDGSLKIKQDSGKMQVLTSDLIVDDDVTQDHSWALKQGYMYSPKDWLNFEATAYCRVNNHSSGRLIIYGRSGRHIEGSELPMACLGCAYGARIFIKTASTDITKEPWHHQYFHTDEKIQRSLANEIVGKWIGIKMICYNITQNSENKSVRIELWIDPRNNNHWKLIDSNIDDGRWDKLGKDCNRPKEGQPIFWGGPEVVFKWVSISDLDIQKMSVREISMLSPYEQIS